MGADARHDAAGVAHDGAAHDGVAGDDPGDEGAQHACLVGRAGLVGRAASPTGGAAAHAVPNRYTANGPQAHEKSGDENAAAGEMDFTTTAIVAGNLLVLIIMASMTAVTLLGFFFVIQCRIIAECKYDNNVAIIVVVIVGVLILYGAYSINELGNKSVDAAAGVFSTAHSMFFSHRKSPTNTPLHSQDTCNARADTVTTLPGLFYLNADQITILRKHFCG